MISYLLSHSINATYSYLTNLEVMQLLVKIKSTKKKFGMRNLATVTYEVSAWAAYSGDIF